MPYFQVGTNWPVYKMTSVFDMFLMVEDNMARYMYVLYENMPMQYTVIFHGCKNGNF